MAKKQVSVSLRKPPPVDESLARNEAFVAGADAKPETRELARTFEPRIVTTRVGERREMLVYLPEDVARKLSVRCMEMDRDVSNVIAEAVLKDLDGPPKAEVVQPMPMMPMMEALDRAKHQLKTLLKARQWGKLGFVFS